MIIDSTRESHLFRHTDLLAFRGFLGITPNRPISIPGRFLFLNDEAEAESLPISRKFIKQKPSVVIGVHSSFYHLMVEGILLFVEAYEKHPNAHFIFQLDTDSRTVVPELFNFFVEILDYLKVDYEFIDVDNDNWTIVNNVIYCHLAYHDFPRVGHIEKFKKFIADYVGIKDSAPFRKVYLSRERVLECGISDPRRVDAKYRLGKSRFVNDRRMDDEPSFEKYLMSAGFEIVHPDSFKDFRSQIKFFAETKLIVSTTNSGIANCLFMPAGGTVLEIMVPMVIFFNTDGVVDGSEEATHDIYRPLVFAADHTLVQLPSKNRALADIMGPIRNNSYLQNLIFGE